MTPPQGRRGISGSIAGFEDRDGGAAVICAFCFADGAPAALEHPELGCGHDGRWSWTHLRLGDVRGLHLLRQIPDLPAEALELFVGGETRVQIVEAEGWVFGVLPDLERDLAGQPQRPGRLPFAFDGARLITGRLHALSAVDDLRRAAQGGTRLASPAAAIVAQVEFYADRVETLLEDLAHKLEAVEDFVLAERRNPPEAELTNLRREITRLRRELQGLRSALVRAHTGRRVERRVSAFAEELVELTGAVEDLDHDAGVLQDRGRLLHEEIDTLINSATNRNMRALTIISTLLIPPTLITGAFGMNVPGLPFEHSPSGFVLVTFLCALVVGGALLVLKRMGM